MKERQSVTAVVAVRYRKAGKKGKGQILSARPAWRHRLLAFRANAFKRFRINPRLLVAVPGEVSTAWRIVRCIRVAPYFWELLS